ncbi:MAG: hypothetical protein CO070_06850, partial [Gallionellales bacterium CG_4_9_14_0_8_um_filter_55_61]
MTVPVRLAKYLASSLPCSRREAELYIEGGWVSVEGLVVEEPQFMVSQQQVTLHPDAQLTPVAPVTLLFNQPFDYTPADTAPLTNPVQINAAMQSPDDCSGIHLLKRHFVKVGYPSIYGNATIMKWNQRSQPPSARLPKL